MSQLKHIIACTSMMLLSIMTLFAQLSDQQVVEELKLYRTSGMTQEQVMLELSKKGVTAEQIERIKQRYMSGELRSTATGTTSSTNTEERNRTYIEQFNTSSVLTEVATGIAKLDTNSVYGREIFSSKNLTFQPNVNIPTPTNYILGAGDEVIIDIWGTTELSVREKISPDGTILIQGIGPIQLSGLQIERALAKLRNAFGQIYSDLLAVPARAFISLTLGNTRSIQVNILGEVSLPGTYTLSPFSTVFNALYSAGGINDIGTLRDIQVSRNGKVIAHTDVYDYLIKGTSSGDITLRDGDIVRVKPYKKRVQILGAVMRPMWYDLKDGETLESLINYAGGFLGDAYQKNLTLTRQGDTEQKVYTIEQFQYKSFVLHNADIIRIEKILSLYENRVTIEGSVFRPGEYAISSEMKTVKQLLQIAQGPTGDAFLYRALLYRENPDLTQMVIPVDLEALMSGKAQDIELQKNDKLHVSSTISLDDKKYVEISGYVRHPKKYDYADSMSVEDLIIQAGGLLESASLARVDIFRRIKNPMSTEPAKQTGENFSVNLKDGLIVNDSGNATKFILKPYDLVVIRNSPGYETQQIIKVEGEVLFEGSYAKLEKNERISSLIKRAGGLTKDAYVKGARLIRTMNAEELKRLTDAIKLSERAGKDSLAILDSEEKSETYFVGIDLEKAISKPGTEDDIVLRDGDVVSVPQYNGTVKISGAVMYPNVITYNKHYSLRDYIRNAGGYALNAKSNKVYVVYLNGKVASGIWSKIEPGCEIIVPTKPERTPMTLQEITGISSSVLSITILVVTLLKRF